MFKLKRILRKRARVSRAYRITGFAFFVIALIAQVIFAYYLLTDFLL